MSMSTTGLRKSAAVALGAVGIAALGGVAAANTASAAEAPSAHQQHLAHVQHAAHLAHELHVSTTSAHAAHLRHLHHVAHENELARAASATAAHLHHLHHVAHVNQATQAESAHLHHLHHVAHVNQSSASSSATTVSDIKVSGGSAQQIAAELVPAGQLASFDQIISHESGWNVHAVNASSGAYGLPQALPGSKMASEGSDWRDSATTQLKWALNYMDSRYGSPNAAWSFWQAHNWY